MKLKVYDKQHKIRQTKNTNQQNKHEQKPASQSLLNVNYIVYSGRRGNASVIPKHQMCKISKS